MKSWTRTLNLDDAHWMLANAAPKGNISSWEKQNALDLRHLSRARQRELIRIVRSIFIATKKNGEITDSSFLRFYHSAPATAQLDLVAYRWALSHPLSLIACQKLIEPAIEQGEPSISLHAIDELVKSHVSTSSHESLRKSRTVLVGALQGIGVVDAIGTGKHRSVKAKHGAPHPICFAQLFHEDLRERDEVSMMAQEALESSLPSRISLCTLEHAQLCVNWCIDAELLWSRDDEIGAYSHNLV